MMSVMMLLLFLFKVLKLYKTNWVLTCWDIFSVILVIPSISHPHLYKLGRWFNIVQVFVNKWVLWEILSIVFVVKLKVDVGWWFHIIKIFINKWITWNVISIILVIEICLNKPIWSIVNF